MKHSLRTVAKALALAGLLVSGVSQAASLDYLSNTADGATAGWGATVQTFLSTSNQTLASYSFVGGAGAQGPYKFSLYDWTTNSAALYASTQGWVAGVNVVSGINLGLQAGHLYAAEVDYLGTTPGGVVFGGNAYADGNGFWGASGLNGNQGSYTSFTQFDTAFKADFSAAAVPEESTGVMLLGGLGMLAWMGRRQRKAS